MQEIYARNNTMKTIYDLPLKARVFASLLSSLLFLCAFMLEAYMTAQETVLLVVAALALLGVAFGAVPLAILGDKDETALSTEEDAKDGDNNE